MTAVRLLLTLSILMNAAITAYAEDYVLFEKDPRPNVTWKSVPNPNYNEIVSRLAPGDRVTFSNGKTFVIEGVLGGRNTSIILEVRGAPPSAVRIPKMIAWMDTSFWPMKGSDPYLPDRDGNPSRTEKASRNHYEHKHLREYIDSTIRGYPDLRENNVPTVEVIESLEGEYVHVSKTENFAPGWKSFTLRDFIEGNIPAEIEPYFEKMAESLIDFARKSARLSRIADFDEDQLIFDFATDRWRLPDWMEMHVWVSEREKSHLLDSFFYKFRVDQVEVALGGGKSKWKVFEDTPHRRRMKELLQRIDSAVSEAMKSFSPAGPARSSKSAETKKATEPAKAPRWLGWLPAAVSKVFRRGVQENCLDLFSQASDAR